MRKLLLLYFIITLLPIDTLCQEDYSVLNYWKYYSDAENTLYKMQSALSFDMLDERKEAISNLKTKEDWINRQEQVRISLQKILGPFPEKSPLNPVITGKVKRDGFTVEKLYFESLPGYKVTAALFLPAGRKKNLPTIIYCSGHSDLAFRSDTYQHVIINLVLKGFAVFAFDPVGQGERQQYFDAEAGKSKFRPTHEHSYPGAQLFINGASAARYMIWDGIRAVDYLLTRKEVDPDRIGITGRSGGGTQSSHIAAIDDRIKASAPECYITTFEYLFKSRGPQDAEQNFYHGIKEGIDLGDLLQVRAPKPSLMITTTRDIFSIQGARDVFAETMHAYEAFDRQQNFEMVEDDAPHASTPKNREAMYAFFQKHLDNPGTATDQEVEIFPVEELYVTSTGQLSTSIGSRFLFDINLDLTETNMEKKMVERKAASFIKELPSKVEAISGFQKHSSARLVFSGRTDMGTYFLEKYLLEDALEFVTPFRFYAPKSGIRQLALVLCDQNEDLGKEAYAQSAFLAANGVGVLVPDLPGFGSLGPGYLRGDAYFKNTSYNQWFAGIQNGRSTVAVHVAVIQRLLDQFIEHKDLQDLPVCGISRGGFNSSLMHASVLGVDFAKLILQDPLLSFASMVMHKEYAPSYIPFAVAGSLQFYDLPDLVTAFAPKPVLVVNGRNHVGEPEDITTVESLFEFAKKRYVSLSVSGGISVRKTVSNEELLNYVID